MSSSDLSVLFTGEVRAKLTEPNDSIRVVMKKQLAAHEIYTSHGLIAALCVAETRMCVVVVMRWGQRFIMPPPHPAKCRNLKGL